jgi:MerR family transcriptional regulator, light-induced transcriptional regulator
MEIGLTRALPIGLASSLTGVSTSTIRAWERRYGVPLPSRAPNGRRSYGPAALNQIRLMGRLVAGGLPPSLAAKRVKSGVDKDPNVPENAETNDGELIPLDTMLQAVNDFDADALTNHLKRQALALPSHLLFDRIIVPLMQELNVQWASFQPIDRVQEYVTTETVRRVMHELSSMIRPVVPRGRVLIAPFQNDVHELPLDALAFMLSSHGFRTVQLGPMTSPEALKTVIERVKPDLVALSASSQVNGVDVSKLIQAYGNACDSIPWIVGGSAARSMREAIEGEGATVVLDGRALDNYLETFLI